MFECFQKSRIAVYIKQLGVEFRVWLTSNLFKSIFKLSASVAFLLTDGLALSVFVGLDKLYRLHFRSWRVFR